MTNFSEFFKEAVKTSGRTREDLANQIGCPIGYISAQEMGVVPPPVSFKLLRRAAEVLNVDLITGIKAGKPRNLFRG